MMLRCRFLFVWLLLVLLNLSLKSVYPLSLRDFFYWHLDELKTSSLEEFLDKYSLIIFGNWLTISGGWLEDLLIYNNKLFGFLYGLYVPLFKLNVMSKKYAILRLVSTSMVKPMSLNVLIIFLRIWSICWPFTFRNMSSPSSLYKAQCLHSCLIYPSKSELGKVSTSILENINQYVIKLLHIIQWKNSANVIEWFRNIEDKKNCPFIKFDIKEF